MKCDDIKSRLPEYLAGACTDEEQDEITAHLGSCEQCMADMITMQKSLDVKTEVKQQKEAAVLMHKARKKLLARIRLQVVAVALAIMLLFGYVLPMVGFGIRGMGVANINRAFVDIVQFSDPRTVSFFSNTGGSLLTYSMDFRVGTVNYTGTKAKTGFDYKGSMNVITGSIYSPNYFGADFIHPTMSPTSEDYDKSHSPELLKKNLSKNAQNTVASVDISLKKNIQPSDVESILKNYDIDILWMAVECGYETVMAKNATWGQGQVVQWGVPGKLMRTEPFGYQKLGRENTAEFFQEAMKEMEWLNKHHRILKHDKDMEKLIGKRATNQQKSGYVLENGFQIYGLRITGPTEELLRLTDQLDIRYGRVNDIDFWYWK